MTINSHQSSDNSSQHDVDQYLNDAEQIVMHDILAEMVEKLQRAGCSASEVSSFIAAAMTEDPIQIALAVVAIRKGIETRERVAAASEYVF